MSDTEAGSAAKPATPAVQDIVRLMKTPMSGVVSMASTRDTIIFGTLSGTIHIHQLAIGPHGRPYFGLQGKELPLNDGSVPIDVVIVCPSGDLAACLVGGKELTIVANVGKRGAATGRRPGRYNAPSDAAPYVVCRAQLEAQYTSRACSHCWLDDDTVALGCVDGTVRVIVVDLSTDSTGPETVVVREDAPIVHLQYDGASRTLCVSTLSRSGFITNCGRGTSEADASFTQIGVKARSQGLYGACLSPKTNRIYAARPSRRIFEADPSNGTVFKTFKLPECKHELSILKVVADVSAAAAAAAVPGAEDEVLLVSESPKFLGLVSLGASSSWKLALHQAERAFVCGMQFMNFFLFLCSDDQVMSVEVCPPPRPPSPGCSAPAQNGASVQQPQPQPQQVAPKSDEELPQPAFVVKPLEPAPAAVPSLAIKAASDSHSSVDTSPDFVMPDGQVSVKLMRRPKAQDSPTGSSPGGSPPSAAPVATQNSADFGSESPVQSSGLTTSSHPAAPPSSTSSGKRVVRVVKKRIVRTTSGVRTEIVGETRREVVGPSNATTISSQNSDRSSPTEPAAPASFPVAAAQPQAKPQPQTVLEEVRHAHVDPQPATAATTAPTTTTIDSPMSTSPPAAAKPPLAQTLSSPTPTMVKEARAPSPPVSAMEPRPESPPAPLPPALLVEKRPPTAIDLFRKDTDELYATHSALSLDRKAQPRLLADMVRWAKVLDERLNDRSDSDASVADASRAFFREKQARQKIIALLVDGLEWLSYVPLPDGLDDVVVATSLYRQLERLNITTDDDACSVYDKICTGVAKLDKFHDISKRAAAQCVLLCNDNAFPLLDTIEVDSWETRDESFSAVEEKLLSMSQSIVEDLQFRDYSLCFVIHYFPYLFALLPSKATQVALATFPNICIRHIQWSLSGHVQTQAVTVLKACRASVTRMDSDDLADCLCDITLRLIHEHNDHIMQKQSFVRCIEVLLERRCSILTKEGLDATPSPNTPTAKGPKSMPGKPSMLVVRKLRRLDDAAMEMLKGSKLKLNIAFPELRSLFDRFNYPRGVVEIRAIEQSIEDAVKSNRIDRLLPLFQMDDVITESNWISLFINSHTGSQLERAVYLCLTVVQQPRRVRYLLRKAFPFVDSPDIDDEQLKGVVEKLSALIN